uniref:Large ribosomal subunit protein bL28 n=1 Tax=candidate division CPR3 bacterium TaxID=2268181 RepID=A0A7C4R4K1_UNCC3
MSKVCEICDKKRSTGNNVSHSQRKTKRVFLPNIQKISIEIDGKKKQIKVCSKCIKTLGKSKI